MTPRDKAFYEYGKSVERLHSRILEIRIASIFHYNEEYKNLPDEDRKELCLQHCLSLLVSDIRQKWAACRAWTIQSHERICENCEDEGTHPLLPPCSECSRCPFTPAYDGFSDNWKPKKEGK